MDAESKDLLRRYMAFVEEEEGTDFIEYIDHAEQFSTQEKELLKELSKANGWVDYQKKMSLLCEKLIDHQKPKNQSKE